MQTRCPYIHDTALLIAVCQVGVVNAMAQSSVDPVSPFFPANLVMHVRHTFGMTFMMGNLDAAVAAIVSMQPSQQQVRDGYSAQLHDPSRAYPIPCLHLPLPHALPCCFLPSWPRLWLRVTYDRAFTHLPHAAVRPVARCLTVYVRSRHC